MYDGLLGEHVPKETTVKKTVWAASRILELCDTSNMVELPVDKDGELSALVTRCAIATWR